MVVITGSLTGMRAVSAGQSVGARIDGLGAVAVRLA
jgi:2-keto-4-pentenoate hydratase